MIQRYTAFEIGPVNEIGSPDYPCHEVRLLIGADPSVVVVEIAGRSARVRRSDLLVALGVIGDRAPPESTGDVQPVPSV